MTVPGRRRGRRAHRRQRRHRADRRLPRRRGVPPLRAGPGAPGGHRRARPPVAGRAQRRPVPDLTPTRSAAARSTGARLSARPLARRDRRRAVLLAGCGAAGLAAVVGTATHGPPARPRSSVVGRGGAAAPDLASGLLTAEAFAGRRQRWWPSRLEQLRAGAGLGAPGRGSDDHAPRSARRRCRAPSRTSTTSTT